MDELSVLWDGIEIGTLTRAPDGSCEFVYGGALEQARQRGFTPLVGFPDAGPGKTYWNHTLFPTFACRLPPPDRRDMDRILRKYGLAEYDEFELLGRSGGALPYDQLSFCPTGADNPQSAYRLTASLPKEPWPCGGIISTAR